MLPRLRAGTAPQGLQRTCSRAGGSLTMVRRKSQVAATSWGDLANLAPAATSSSARAGVRFQTVSEWPALMRFMPMGRPIKPRPMSTMCFAGEFKRDLLDDGLASRASVLPNERRLLYRFWAVRSECGVGAEVQTVLAP